MKTRNNKGGVAIVVTIVLIVAMTTAMVTWLATTKTQVPVQQAQLVPIDETTDWENYKNALYGFEIRYPSSYSIFQEADDKNEKFIPADLNSKRIFIAERPRMFFSSEPIYLSVEVLDSYVADFEKWITDNKIVTPGNTYRITKRGNISFAGEQAYQVQAEIGIDSPGNIILLNHDSKTYYIRYDSLPVLEKISSTFKFTN